MKIREKTVSASEFKAKCLRMLEELGPQGIIITKRGRPIARLAPISPANHERLYGCLKGKLVVKGDILSTGIKWHAQS